MNKYPDFSPLALEDKPLFDRAFKADPPQVSEFTFTNLYAWRNVYGFMVSLLSDCIVFYAQAGGERKFFCPVGCPDKKAAMEALREDGAAVFIRVPEGIKTLFEGDPRVIIEADHDNADYLYKAADLVKLEGRKYDGKRNLIRKFKSARAYEYAALAASNVDECLEFQEKWCVIKNCDTVEGLSNERQALSEMIAPFSEFNLLGAMIKVEGEVSGVALAEALNPQTLVVHALKADPGIPGLYQALCNEFLSRQDEAFTYVNMEQDLGVEGLRKAKRSYHPVAMVKKFTLRAGSNER